MTKADLAVFVADETGCSKAKATRFIDKLVSEMSKDLASGISVSIPGLCIIKPVTRAARGERMGRNPATGESLQIQAVPERKTIKAKPSAELKRVLNN